MTTLKDFVPLVAKKAFIAAFALLVVFVTVSQVCVALRTGVVRRLSSTPRYTRSKNPVMFWLLVTFFGALALFVAGLLAAVFVHWNDQKSF